MRLGVLSALLVLATACEGGGVEIIVFPPAEAGATKPDEVRLYVGLGAGEATRELTASFHGDTKHHGQLWDRDMDYDVATPSSPDSPVHFTYAARGANDTISVIAVGLDGGKPTSAVARYEMVVPTAHVAVYTVGLNPAVAAAPGVTDNNQIELWGPDPGDASCAHLIDTRADHDDPRYPVSFIASGNDEDCDGFVAGDKAECDDHAYRSTVTPAIGNLSCISDKPYPGSAGSTSAACRFGGLDCTDGDPAGRNDCRLDRRAYCAPQSLCDRCVTPEEDKPFECAIDPVGPNPQAMSAAFAFDCLVPMGMGANQNRIPCLANYNVTISTGVPGCTNPMWHGPNKSDGWTQKVSLGSFTLGIGLTANQTACSVHLTSTALPDVTMLPKGGLLAVDLSNNRGFVVPVVFSPDPQTRTECEVTTLEIQCFPRVAANETALACLGTAPTSP